MTYCGRLAQLPSSRLGFSPMSDIFESSIDLQRIVAPAPSAFAAARPYLVMDDKGEWLVTEADPKWLKEISGKDFSSLWKPFKGWSYLRHKIKMASSTYEEDSKHSCVDFPKVETAWNSIAEVFRQMTEFTKSIKTQFIVLTNPTSNLKDVVRIPIALRKDKFIVCTDHEPAKRVAALLKDFGVPSIDLVSSFKKHLDVRSYYRFDAHWTKSGHQVAAKAVIEDLLKRGALKKDF